MTPIEILEAQIARARAYFQRKGHLEYLCSARDTIDASALCGQGVTLNDNQCRALAIFLESQAAMREVRKRQGHAAPAGTPANIVRFSRN